MTHQPARTSDLDLDHIQAGIDRDRLRERTILVTGAAGALGYYLTRFLVERSSARAVVALDLFPSGVPAWMADLRGRFPDKLILCRFDIAHDAVASIPDFGSFTHIFHLASNASPTRYRLHPLATLDATVWGLRGLLDACDPKVVEGFVYFSSSEVYGDPSPDQVPTPESYRGNTSTLGPRACYDEAKRFGETLCYVFHQERHLPVTIVRPFNNYGPGMSLTDGRLPADLARSVLEGRDIVLHSDGSPRRTFCYVADAIIGYLKAAVYGRFDVFNIGAAGPEISVRELAEVFRREAAALLGYTGAIRYEAATDEHYLTHNPQRRCPVADKARHALGFETTVSVEEGVRRYLRFLREESVRV